MDIIGWLWWGIAKVLGVAWSFVWFLLGGWVAALLQILIIVGVVFALKYGWRRAPTEMWTRGSAFGRFVWAWARNRGPSVFRPAGEPGGHEPVQVIRFKEPGDVNASTVLSVLMLVGLLVAGAL